METIKKIKIPLFLVGVVSVLLIGMVAWNDSRVQSSDIVETRRKTGLLVQKQNIEASAPVDADDIEAPEDAYDQEDSMATPLDQGTEHERIQIEDSATASQRPDETPAPKGVSQQDWNSIYEAYENHLYSFVEGENGFRIHNPNQRFSATVDLHGFSVSSDHHDVEWGLDLVQYGFRGEEFQLSEANETEIHGPRLTLKRDSNLTEWYLNKKEGLEQGWTLYDRPYRSSEDASEKLNLTLAIFGDVVLESQVGGKELLISDSSGQSVMSYSGLKAWDADGVALDARFTVETGRLLVSVDESQARYPVYIDPIIETGSLVSGSFPDIEAHFGSSVAISGDTVVVGATGDDSGAIGVDGDYVGGPWEYDSGAVYVFQNAGGSWELKHYLKASNPQAEDWFGSSVSIDGDTLVIGAPGEDGGVLDDPDAEQDNSAESSGAAYVFKRMGDSWLQVNRLKAANMELEDGFGQSVAISGDIIVVGATGEDGVDAGNPDDNSKIDSGAAYVFQMIDSVWKQTHYVKSSNPDSEDWFGSNVAISDDTFVVGARGEDGGDPGNPGDNSQGDSGAAYVFQIAGSSLVQQDYLKPSNLDSEDRFGTSVAISGATVVVGAPGEDGGDPGNPGDNSQSDSGAVYVFQRTNDEWSETGYLKAMNLESPDSFGHSVAISTNTIVVGALGEDGGDPENPGDNSQGNSGAAYVFQLENSSWTQRHYVKSNNPDLDDWFGSSVAISGNSFVVGAPGEDGGDLENPIDNTKEDSGAGYLFSLSSTVTLESYLKPQPNPHWDNFGVAVAVSGEMVVVGAQFEDSATPGVNGDHLNDGMENSGAAYVFIRRGNGWKLEAYLKASNPGINDSFGGSVAISGNTIAVGAAGESSFSSGVINVGDDPNPQYDNASTSSGAAYVFRRNAAGWSQESYLKASNADAGDVFGARVAISGDTIVVASWFEDSYIPGDPGKNGNTDSGAAYVFVRNASDWSQEAILKASNADPNDYFGSTVAISGDTIVVSANREDSGSSGVDGNGTDNSLVDSGAAYVYQRSAANEWFPQGYLKANNPDAYDRFGNAVAISGDRLVVGAFFEDGASSSNPSSNDAVDSGAAYVFERSNSVWSFHSRLKASIADPNDQFGTSVAISGDSIVVGAPGEDGGAIGVDGDQGSNSAPGSGAAYLFRYHDGQWLQTNYFKSKAYVTASDVALGLGKSVSVSGPFIVAGGNGGEITEQFQSTHSRKVHLYHTHLPEGGLGGPIDKPYAPSVNIPDGLGVWFLGVPSDTNGLSTTVALAGRQLVSKKVTGIFEALVFLENGIANNVLDPGETIHGIELVEIRPFLGGNFITDEDYVVDSQEAVPIPVGVPDLENPFTHDLLKIEDDDQLADLRDDPDEPVTFEQQGELITNLVPNIPTQFYIPWRSERVGLISWPSYLVSYRSRFAPGSIRLARDAELGNGGPGVFISGIDESVSVKLALTETSDGSRTLDGDEFVFDPTEGTLTTIDAANLILKIDLTPETPGDSIFEAIQAIDHESGELFDDQVSLTLIGEEIEIPQDTLYGIVATGSNMAEFASPDGQGQIYSAERGLAGKSGQIIPVNEGVLEVWWYQKYDVPGTSVTIEYPAMVRRYDCRWPDDPALGQDAVTLDEIVIANEMGTGLLNAGEFPQADVYYQNDPGLIGYNPNDEHAFRDTALGGGEAIFALRNDLWNPLLWSGEPGANASKPYVLMHYQDPANTAKYRFKVYKVLDVDGDFDFSTETPTPSTEHQWTLEVPLPFVPPHPLRSGSLTDILASRALPGTDNVFEDRNGVLYALHADGDNVAKLQWQYQLSEADDFYWPEFLPEASEFTAIISEDSIEQVGQTVTLTFEGAAFRALSGSHSLQIFNSGDDLNAPLDEWGLTGNTDTTLRFDIEPTDVPPAEGQIIRVVNQNVDLVWFLNDGTGPFDGDFAVEINAQPVDYELTWPEEVDEVLLGETTDVVGDVNNQESIEIIHDQSNYRDPDFAENEFDLDPQVGRTRSLKVINWGSTSPGRSVEIAVNDFPSGPIEDLGSFKEFPTLSPALRKKIRYYLIHPTNPNLNQHLVVSGVKIQISEFEKYFILNVLSEDEAQELRDLANDSRFSWSDNEKKTAFTAAIESLISGSSSIDDISLPVFSGLDVSRFSSQALTSADSTGKGYVTLVFNDFTGELPSEKTEDPPVQMKVVRVPARLYSGALHLQPDGEATEIDEAGKSVTSNPFRDANPFDEKLDLLFSGDLGGNSSDYEFQWRAIPASDWEEALESSGALEGDLPDYYPGATLDPGWNSAIAPIGPRSLAIRAGQPYVMQSHYFITRYKPTHSAHPLAGQWSDWTKQKKVDGWLIRALGGTSPFNADDSILYRLNNITVGFNTTLLQEAGPPPTDVALTPDGARNAGLIAIYKTLFERGKDFSLDIGIVNDSINEDLLTTVGKLSDLYMLLGNEAFADAADPTVPIGGVGDVTTPGNVHAFMGFENINSLLDEELALLRGRDSLTAFGVTKAPIYNRIAWNFDVNTAINPQAAAVYYNNYNLGATTEENALLAAKQIYPQGHGDAWGHYLSAQRYYYELLREPNFEWRPRFRVISVSGGNAQIDRFEERRFAEIAAAKAQTGLETTRLVHRKYYLNTNPSEFNGEEPPVHIPDPDEDHWQGYKDRYTNSDGARRAWGVDDWAVRTGEGAYLDWVMGNALLPDVDEDPNNTGIQRLDRRNVTELDEIVSTLGEVQNQLDMVDNGLSPLGVPDNAIPFDIDASQYNQGVTHFEQVLKRAETDVINAYAVFRDAQGLSEGMRQQFDTQADYDERAEQQSFDYRNRLVEVFGYPYPEDTLYDFGYNGPDVLHYMYVDPSSILNLDQGEGPTETVTLRFKDISISNFAFDGQQPAQLDFTPQEIDIAFERSTAGYGFVKPTSWSQRKAPGEIQLARADVIQARYRLERATLEYDNLINQIEDQVQLLEARTGLQVGNFQIQYGASASNRNLNDEIKRSRRNQLVFRTIGRIAQSTANAVAEGVPKSSLIIVGTSSGVGGDFTSAARAAIRLTGTRLNEVFSALGDNESLRELGFQQSKEELQSLNQLRITAANSEFEALSEIKRIEGLIRQEATARLEMYSLFDVLQQTAGRYQSALARGERLLEEYIRFRQRTSGEAAEARYRDLAFRVFRDDKLEKYRAHFDRAAKSLYRAALALDYEINWQGFSPSARRNFLSGLVRARAIGDASNDTPAFGDGDTGLAGLYAQLNSAWLSAESILRINNPEVGAQRILLRNELFRIPNASRRDAETWSKELESHIVTDMGTVPEVVKHLDFEWISSFDPQLGAITREPEEAMVIMFPTVINSELNSFGFPFNFDIDSRFVSTSFANRISNVGVWLRGVSSLSPTANIEVYLVPVGNDVLKNPRYVGPNETSEMSRFTEWKILEEVLPLPILLNKDNEDVLTQTLHRSWIPSMHASSFTSLNSGDGSSYRDGSVLYGSQNTYPFAVRRYGAFLANHDNVSQEHTSRSSRLMGRSVWNTRWMLVIPGRSIDMESLLDQLTDIELLIDYKKYSSN